MPDDLRAALLGREEIRPLIGETFLKLLNTAPVGARDGILRSYLQCLTLLYVMELRLHELTLEVDAMEPDGWPGGAAAASPYPGGWMGNAIDVADAASKLYERFMKVDKPLVLDLVDKTEELRQVRGKKAFARELSKVQSITEAVVKLTDRATATCEDMADGLVRELNIYPDWDLGYGMPAAVRDELEALEKGKEVNAEDLARKLEALEAGDAAQIRELLASEDARRENERRLRLDAAAREADLGRLRGLFSLQGSTIEKVYVEKGYDLARAVEALGKIERRKGEDPEDLLKERGSRREALAKEKEARLKACRKTGTNIMTLGEWELGEIDDTILVTKIGASFARDELTGELTTPTEKISNGNSVCITKAFARHELETLKSPGQLYCMWEGGGTSGHGGRCSGDPEKRNLLPIVLFWGIPALLTEDAARQLESLVGRPGSQVLSLDPFEGTPVTVGRQMSGAFGVVGGHHGNTSRMIYGLAAV